jgi:CubicO group peptidase (beta-lactamase class C family)
MRIEEIVGDNFSGVISIRRNDNVLFQKSYGFMDIANEIPNEIDTKFATASAGKVFVAVGILQLIENGKLKLSDIIGDILI